MHSSLLLRFQATLAGAYLVLCAVNPGGAALADVIALANRTNGAVSAQFLPRTGTPQPLKLAAGDVMPLFLDGGAHLEFNARAGAKRYQLDPNCAYYFGRTAAGDIDLQKIGLGEQQTELPPRSMFGSASRAPAGVIPIKILVDEDEPTLRPHWERRLRRRIEAASAILERHSRISLRVVAIETWNSDNATTDFVASLAEFEREVSPSPARLAIGFTAQWPMVRGRVHMAGTRGPLHTHILVRDNAPNLSEPEKVEFLVHELGHYLGAGHSPERNSVMRPVLGDKQAGPGFRIQFDPVNTLIIAMVGEEVRRRRIKSFSELSPATQIRLRQIYKELARTMPRDPSLKQYVEATRRATQPSQAERKSK